MGARFEKGQSKYGGSYRELTHTIRLRKNVFKWLEVTKTKSEYDNVSDVVKMLIKEFLKDKEIKK